MRRNGTAGTSGRGGTSGAVRAALVSKSEERRLREGRQGPLGAAASADAATAASPAERGGDVAAAGGWGDDGGWGDGDWGAASGGESDAEDKWDAGGDEGRGAFRDALFGGAADPEQSPAGGGVVHLQRSAQAAGMPMHGEQRPAPSSSGGAAAISRGSIPQDRDRIPPPQRRDEQPPAPTPPRAPSGQLSVCEKCGASVPMEQDREHRDWHLAMAIDAQERRGSPGGAAAGTNAASAGGGRAGKKGGAARAGAGSKRKAGGWSIDTFFTKGGAGRGGGGEAR